MGVNAAKQLHLQQQPETPGSLAEHRRVAGGQGRLQVWAAILRGPSASGSAIQPPPLPVGPADHMRVPLVTPELALLAFAL